MLYRASGTAATSARHSTAADWSRCLFPPSITSVNRARGLCRGQKSDTARSSGKASLAIAVQGVFETPTRAQFCCVAVTHESHVITPLPDGLVPGLHFAQEAMLLSTYIRANLSNFDLKQAIVIHQELPTSSGSDSTMTVGRLNAARVQITLNTMTSVAGNPVARTPMALLSQRLPVAVSFGVQVLQQNDESHTLANIVDRLQLGNRRFFDTMMARPVQKCAYTAVDAGRHGGC